MGQFYTNPKRESNPYALPDAEVFEVSANRNLRKDFDYNCECGYLVCSACDRAIYPMEADNETGESPMTYCCSAEALSPGWYWWACFPGCLPDSEPNGPFDTREAAIADAQEDCEDYEDDE